VPVVFRYRGSRAFLHGCFTINMKKILLFLILYSTQFPVCFSQIKALVGGTLIDGFGGKPLYNSVIIIEGETIKQVGRFGEIKIPSKAAIISTEGMSVLPGL